MRHALLAALVLIPPGAAAQTRPAAMDFLVQSQCLDAEAQPRPGLLPFQPGCDRPAPLRDGEPMAYRKHDWPAPEHRPGAPLGYQASDAYAGTLRGLPAAIQTFDFGTGPYRYGRFDRRADGGDAVVLRGDEASIGVSEDSDGVKWLLGTDCRAGGGLAPGWLAFRGIERADEGEEVAPNAIAPGPDACPRAFTRSLTRWRLGPLDMPYLIRGEPAGTFRADTVVSEHYTHPTVPRSNAMERFWFARHLGKVRWESWVNLDAPGVDRAKWSAAATTYAATRRCPPVQGGTPLERPWVMVECRTWTNFDPATPGALIPPFAWPAQAENR